ncbi:hypothetical protein JI435_408160 [Parastagonospora nodorum SN15]|uniref:Uncharacterized protein n=1 Tax=Phaeosphaeria nodorum (strain SN15 / ATCC MYA-4574 / FGSC 10173) TaxID=321614 RepID=A0A7U2F006_PHANO|nr:hypothetical protein JI435_408160 [Parastagonospora nodorum SN15]
MVLAIVTRQAKQAPSTRRQNDHNNSLSAQEHHASICVLNTLTFIFMTSVLQYPEFGADTYQRPHF